MSANSRIVYQPGGIFIMVRTELVTLLGFASAVIVGYLDFLDRAREKEGEPLATRARIIADLQGVVGKNKIDEALADLTARGWLRKIDRREVRANIVQWAEFALAPKTINDNLRAARDGRLPDFGTPEIPESGPEQAPELGPVQVPKQASPITKDSHLEKHTQKAPAVPGACDDFFEQLWKVYPRQTGRKSAETAYRKHFPSGPSDHDRETILAGLARWKASSQWANGPRWAAGLDRFLAEGIYLEHPAPRGGGMATPIPPGNESPGGPAKLRLRMIEI